MDKQTVEDRRESEDDELAMRFPSDTYSPLASIECGCGDWGDLYVTLWINDETARQNLTIDDTQQVFSISSREAVDRVIAALTSVKDRLTDE